MSHLFGILASAALTTASAGAVYIAPTFSAIEGCEWNDSANAWVYTDMHLCRGTGEDPTVDSQGHASCASGDVPQSVNGRVSCVQLTAKHGSKNKSS
jgi:hypothetical protein